MDFQLALFVATQDAYGKSKDRPIDKQKRLILG
jgi:hypothetical protein